jgi:hypothetical protein
MSRDSRFSVPSIARRLMGSRAARLENAIRATLEPLESRVLLSSIAIQVQHTTDDAGTDTSLSLVDGVYPANTLRDAVNFADGTIGTMVDGSTVTAATITFLPTLTGTITEANIDSSGGTIVFFKSNILVQGIEGDDSNVLSVSGGGNYTVFEVDDNVSSELSDLNIIDGNADGGDGGGIFNDGGTLTLTNCTISGNTATNGGGVFSSGNLTATTCTIDGDGATGFLGGGIDSIGYLNATNDYFKHNTYGAVSIEGDGIISNNMFKYNSDGARNVKLNTTLPIGGAIIDQGKLAIYNSYFSDNNSSGSGAIEEFNFNAGGDAANVVSLNIVGSTFQNNAGHYSGAIRADNNCKLEALPRS